MKLLIGDDKKIKCYPLPQKVENFYIINVNLAFNGLLFNETLTLKSENNQWMIIADDKLSIKNNGAVLNSVVLKENIFFELKFADMSDYFKIYVIPDFNNFISYSLNNIDNINIGSANDCAIYHPNLVNLAVSINKDGYDYNIEKIDSKVSSYLNSYGYNKLKLNVGDVIFVQGIYIIYMKEFISICNFNVPIQISNLNQISNTSSSIATPVTPVNDIEKNVKLYDDSQVFVHTPRLKNNIEEEVILFEAPPQKEDLQKMPAILTLGSSAIIGLTSSVSIITSFRSFTKGETDFFSFVLEVVVFGLMLISSMFIPMLTEAWEKHRTKKREKLRQKKYKQYITDQEALVANCITKQENILKVNNLSLEKITQNILNDCKDVWNREIFDTDFLSIVLGIGNIPAKIKINSPQKTFTMDDDNLRNLVFEVSSRKNELNTVPITFSILDNIVVPIVIDSQYSDDYIKSVMLQLIYFHSGNDLKIITITNEYNEKKWDFMKYLPHSWNSNYDRCLFASSEEEVMQLSMFLEREYDNKVNGKSNEDTFSGQYLIVTDDYKLAREISIINKILDTDKNNGFSVLIFESSINNLPSKFNTLIQIVDNNGRIIERNTANKEQISFTASYLPNLEIETYAKVISNIPLNVKSAKYDIPSSLTFLDMFYAGRVEQLNILQRWASNNPTISLKAPIGMKDGNKLIELDLHEKYHGPHGLIAGSTGSGKSEFIITFILSMAVNYHPYEVQFVLIDYKGGGLAGAFENRETGVKLPHLVGTITNLDKSEMNRTLVSIKSELQRRQRVFNEAREKNDESTIDIYKYQRLYREGKVEEPMSHLFIISDEFAELKAQQPEFMDELVSAARIGRSLGVHLILATQKPSGVVDEQIWSNTRFRVCLKVQTTEDSNELLKRNDAAYIKEAGRFYLQVGNDEIFELGQSGWAGAKYVPTDNLQKKLDDNISFISNNGEAFKIVNEEVKKEDVGDVGDQLNNIVKYLYGLAKRENIKFSSLWLENIPEQLLYNDVIKKYQIKSKPYFMDPIIGEYDDPSNQKQGFVNLPLNICGNTYIVGAAGSGKNTLISTMIYSTIINHNVDEVNIYIIDLGAEKLKVFKNAPQVGDVLTINDIQKINFLFYMLKDEKERRFAYYSNNGGSFSQDVEKGKCPFPNIIVYINQIEVFKENFNEIYDEDLAPLTRNCSQVGIFLILTSNVSSSLNYILENNFPKKIMLNVPDQSDYTTYFDNPPVPKKNAGRGVIELNEEAYEFQVPIIFEDYEYDKNIKYILNLLGSYFKKKAKSVPVIPDEVTLDSLKSKISDLNNVPLGINIKTAQLSTYDFNRLFNVITAENNTTAKNFFPILLNIIISIKNTNIIVINSMKNLKLDNLENVKYYDSNFQSILKVINNNVEKYKLEPTEKNFVIIFLGYSQLQKHFEKQKVEDEEIVTIEDLILNSKEVSNFKYIVYENSREIEYISEGKLDILFKRNNGIWLGKDFDTQETFDLINRYDSISLGNSNIALVKNGKTNYVKFM